MKHLLITCSILAVSAYAHAQSPGMNHGKWEENDRSHHKTTSVASNEFESTEMAVNNGTITFSDLPVVKKPAYAVLTNSDGDFIEQTKITPEQNTMEIKKKLRSGLYFVTIVYKNQSKKAFTLNL